MASSFFLIFSLTFLSLSSSALCSSSSTLLNASEILSTSDYLSMSLTLHLAANSKILALHSSSATVFAPSDQAFIRSGQPPLLLLRYHISPSRFPVETLKTLPIGTRIPTLVPNHSLLVTASPSSDGCLSINNVRINEDVFDDGSIVIYGIDEFLSSPLKISPLLEVESFCSVAKFLRSRGYSVIAAFLEAQLMEIGKDQMKLTIFAPVDQAFKEVYAKNMHIGGYTEIFRRHVVPRSLAWKDLIQSELCEVETRLPTFLRGFTINVTVANGVPMLNGSPVVFREVYHSEWLVVHGLDGLIKCLSHQESNYQGPFSKSKDQDPSSRSNDQGPFSKSKDQDPSSKSNDEDPFSKSNDQDPFSDGYDVAEETHSSGDSH